MPLVRFQEGVLEGAGKKPGWKPGDDPAVVFGNPNFSLAIHVIVMSDSGQPMYDQMIRAEQGGGVFLPVDKRGRIYLQQMVRYQTKDPDAWSKVWPNVNVTELGRMSYEIPRGFPKFGEAAADTATRQAREESGQAIQSAEVLGSVCDNTAMSPHMTAVQVGTLDMKQRATDGTDPNEPILKKIKPYSRREIRKLIEDGLLYDNYTLGAIGLYFLLKRNR